MWQSAILFPFCRLGRGPQKQKPGEYSPGL
jgi:hypothetical protein